MGWKVHGGFDVQVVLFSEKWLNNCMKFCIIGPYIGFPPTSLKCITHEIPDFQLIMSMLKGSRKSTFDLLRNDCK